jgi:hypothetical protein
MQLLSRFRILGELCDGSPDGPFGSVPQHSGS